MELQVIKTWQCLFVLKNDNNDNKIETQKDIIIKPGGEAKQISFFLFLSFFFVFVCLFVCCCCCFFFGLLTVTRNDRGAGLGLFFLFL